MLKEFYRVSRLPPYVFAEVNAMKASARARGEDVIDLGMGNPTFATPQHIVEKLTEAVQDPHTHRYSESKGIRGLRKAISDYYSRRFNVDIDPDKEAVVTIGSKEGLATLSSAITGPGDTVLVPAPSYPIHQFGYVIAGATVYNLPVKPNQDFFTALNKAMGYNVPKPIALILNYPNNPTTDIASLDFYQHIVDFCLHHKIYVISDIAYSEIYFDSPPPPSILQVPKAKNIAIEFTSMSKTYSMPGWRIGFACGNSTLVGALTRLKSYLDYGAFTPIQVAAAAALNGPQDCVVEMRNRYKNRRDALISSFNAAGWEIPSPKATMFVWAPIPAAFRHLGSLQFSKLLMQEANLAVSPGVAFGSQGDSYVRLALIENQQRIRQAAKNVKGFLHSYQNVVSFNEATY